MPFTVTSCDWTAKRLFCPRIVASASLSVRIIIILFSSVRRSRFQNSDILRVRSLAVVVLPAGLDLSAESKPNSKITNTKMMGVMLMASSIIDKKSLPRGGRAEHRATDLRWRTRRKHSSQSLGGMHLSSYYFSQAFEDRHFTKRELSFGMP